MPAQNHAAQKLGLPRAPCLGVREFPASFQLLEAGSDEPLADEGLNGERDLGWMLHDIDFADDMTPHFFRAQMRDGLIEVPPFMARELKA